MVRFGDSYRPCSLHRFDQLIGAAPAQYRLDRVSEWHLLRLHAFGAVNMDGAAYG